MKRNTNYYFFQVKAISLLLRKEYSFPKEMQNKSKITQLEAEINQINKKLINLNEKNEIFKI